MSEVSEVSVNNKPKVTFLVEFITSANIISSNHDRYYRFVEIDEEQNTVKILRDDPWMPLERGEANYPNDFLFDIYETKDKDKISGGRDWNKKDFVKKIGQSIDVSETKLVKFLNKTRLYSEKVIREIKKSSLVKETNDIFNKLLDGTYFMVDGREKEKEIKNTDLFTAFKHLFDETIIYFKIFKLTKNFHEEIDYIDIITDPVERSNIKKKLSKNSTKTETAIVTLLNFRISTIIKKLVEKKKNRILYWFKKYW